MEEAMELRQVETFLAVAEELSFSRAASRLGYVQSSVSAQVAALERELGAPLFDRLGRRIALTDAGRVMLRFSGRLLDLAEEAREAVADAGVGSGEVTGTLTVSAPETLLTYRLPRLLALFHERHPKVRLSVRPSAVGRLVCCVAAGLADGDGAVAGGARVRVRLPRTIRASARLCPRGACGGDGVPEHRGRKAMRRGRHGRLRPPDRHCDRGAGDRQARRAKVERALRGAHADVVERRPLAIPRPSSVRGGEPRVVLFGASTCSMRAHMGCVTATFGPRTGCAGKEAWRGSVGDPPWPLPGAPLIRS